MKNQRILAIVHQHTSTPGLIGQILAAAGYSMDIRCPAINDPLPPSLDPYQGVIVFGGPMSANDDQTLPFIRLELQWIEQVLQSAKPYLGICLGAQLLARVLGATVAPHGQDCREIGYHPITPTRAGHALFEPRSLQVYQWHQEGFELPVGATLLAAGATFPHQAFRYGPSAYGLQFHPEITTAMIDYWTTHGADQLTLAGARPRSQHFADHERYGTHVEQWLHRFLNRWVAADEAAAALPRQRQSA